MAHLIAKSMPQKRDKYNWIRLELADNGIMVKYDELVENPMEQKSDFNPDRFHYEDRMKVFQVDENTTIDQALDQGMDLLKKLYSANLGIADTKVEGEGS